MILGNGTSQKDGFGQDMKDCVGSKVWIEKVYNENTTIMYIH